MQFDEQTDIWKFELVQICRNQRQNGCVAVFSPPSGFFFSQILNETEFML